MAPTRETISIRRISILCGLIGGTAFCAAMHYMFEPAQLTRHYSPIFGNLADAPAFVRSYLPLDWLESCVSFGIILFMMIRYGDKAGNLSVRSVAGIGLTSGCFGSATMAGGFGWYSGLEAFVFMAVGMLSAGAVILALVGLVLGLGASSYFVWQRWLAYTWIGRSLAATQRYLEAKDITDPDTASRS